MRHLRLLALGVVVALSLAPPALGSAQELDPSLFSAMTARNIGPANHRPPAVAYIGAGQFAAMSLSGTSRTHP